MGSSISTAEKLDTLNKQIKKNFLLLDSNGYEVSPSDYGLESNHEDKLLIMI